jgi:hypothetical protein
MVRMSWKMAVTLGLGGLSALLMLAHVALFGEPRTLFFYLALDVVFVPVQVLLVTVLIERLLNEREKQAKIRKLNIVISAFMSEVGSGLLRRVDAFCGEAPELAASLAVTEQWGKDEYQGANRFAAQYQARLSPSSAQLAELRTFLLARRPFVLGLLQNSNLLEHEDFTDLLWGVCHLTEELEARGDFALLPESDLRHLQGDIRRANTLLIREWLSYMRHLQSDYPYIFSLAVRTNPFRPDASAIVQT